jgi:Spx/MgsR family transcriptional regulator
MKKTFSWLEAHNISFSFHDYKKEGISSEKLKSWCRQLGWEALLNHKGTTWRQLTVVEKNNIQDEDSAILLMAEKTSIIKRPIIEKENKIILLGFDDSQYATTLM